MRWGLFGYEILRTLLGNFFSLTAIPMLEKFLNQVHNVHILNNILFIFSLFYMICIKYQLNISNIGDLPTTFRLHDILSDSHTKPVFLLNKSNYHLVS